MSAAAEELVGPERRGSSARRPRLRLLWIGVALVGLVGSMLWWRSSNDAGWPGGYGHWTENVTRGDLAKDAPAVASVLDAWRTSRGLRDDTVVTTRLLEAPIDEARVVWVSRVDGQVTAVVRQQVELTYARFHDDDIEGSVPGYVFGFLRAGTDGMQIRQVQVDWGSSPVSVVLGAWVSQAPPLALVLDVGDPILISSAPPDWTADGTYQSPFRRLRFDPDGVAVIRPKAGEDPADLRVALEGSGQGAYGLLGQPYREASEPLTTWQPTAAPELTTVPIAGLRAPAEDAGGAFGAFAIDDLNREQDQSFSTGSWVLAGTVEDDFPVAIGSYSIDGAWRLGLVYGAWGHTRARDAGPLDADAALPVSVRLPDGRGWVVAAPQAKLAYRAPGSSTWTTAGPQAVLLPDAETWEVRVTTAERQQVVTATAAPLSP